MGNVQDLLAQSANGVHRYQHVLIWLFFLRKGRRRCFKVRLLTLLLCYVFLACLFNFAKLYQALWSILSGFHSLCHSSWFRDSCLKREIYGFGWEMNHVVTLVNVSEKNLKQLFGVSLWSWVTQKQNISRPPLTVCNEKSFTCRKQYSNNKKTFVFTFFCLLCFDSKQQYLYSC